MTPRPWSRRPHQPQRLTGRALQRRNQAVLEAHAYICHVCDTGGADRVDHVIPLAEGGKEETEPPFVNCQPIHSKPCHRVKTAEEAQRGRDRRRRRRPKPDHPGIRIDEAQGVGYTPLPIWGRNWRGGAAKALSSLGSQAEILARRSGGLK